MTNLKNKVALVTGSARGIGKAIAERLGALGASVLINYTASERHAQETVRAIERLGGTAIAVQADVSKVADIDRLFATTIERYGRLDIVVANAAVERVGLPLADATESDYDQVFDVNTKGAFFTLRGAAKHIADNGRIVYVGSRWLRWCGTMSVARRHRWWQPHRARVRSLGTLATQVDTVSDSCFANGPMRRQCQFR